MPAPSDSLFRQLDIFMRLRWLAILLTGLLSLIAAIVGGVAWEVLWPALVVAALVIAYSLLLDSVIRRWLPPRGLALVKWIAPLIDTVAVVAMCHFTGGVISPYSLLLLLHILVAALALGPRHAYAGAVWTTALYGTMVVLEATGVLPVVRVTGAAPAWNSLYADTAGTATAFLLMAGLFAIGAAVGDYISRQLRRQQAEITRLYQNSQRETRILQLVNEMSRSLTAILEWPTLLTRVLSEFQGVIPADYAGLYLYDEAENRLRLVATRGFSDQEAREAEATAMEGLPGWVMANRQSLLLSNAERDPRGHCPAIRQAASVLIVPLLYQTRCLGVLCLCSREAGAFGSEEQILLEGLAHQAAVALANARLYEQSRATLKNLRQAQEKLVRSGRLAAVGDLLAGLAHELNNPLGIIVGNAQLAMETAGADEETRRCLQAIGQAGRRITQLVYVLGDLELLREERFQEVDMSKVVQEAVGLLQARAERQGAGIEVTVQSPLPAVWGSRTRLLQVTHDLLLNALESMEGQKRPQQLALRVSADSTEVALTIRDTGRGFSAEQLAHAFEPGFSTKVENGRSRALGLGLFVAYHTVRAHGGEVSLVSQEGGGSMVTVRLPAFASAGNNSGANGRSVPNS